MTTGLTNCNITNTSYSFSDVRTKLVTSNLTGKIKNRETSKQTMHIITTFLLGLKFLINN